MYSVVNWLIDVSFRPSRHTYDPDDTVCVITHGQSVYIRKPIEFNNGKNQKLQGSLWYDRGSPIPKNCLLYLHSLGTNQFECLDLIPFMCSPELCLFSFDFPGCGISEGDYIPLDGNGVHDVESAVNYLKEHFNFEKYCLWGRSMGAAISLHCASVMNNISCCVSDSAYKDTEAVVYDQAELNGIPSFIITLIEPVIKNQAQKTLGTNIISQSPIDKVPFSKTPLLMGHGKQDSFVTISQAQKLFDLYGCPDKQLYIFDARHNTMRPYQWYETASRFIHRKLGITPNKKFYDSVSNSSFIHSGIRERVIEDIDNKIKQEQERQKAKLEREKEDTKQSELTSTATTEVFIESSNCESAIRA